MNDSSRNVRDNKLLAANLNVQWNIGSFVGEVAEHEMRHPITYPGIDTVVMPETQPETTTSNIE